MVANIRNNRPSHKKALRDKIRIPEERKEISRVSFSCSNKLFSFFFLFLICVLKYRGIGASTAVAGETFGDLQELSPARCIQQEIDVGHSELLASSDRQRGAHV